MKVEYRKAWSSVLGRDMEMKIYGHSGKPVLVFPAEAGRFYDYENFGMVEACRPAIDAGRITLFTVDSLDAESWSNRNAHPADRARRHEDYHRYIVDEVVPWIRSCTGGQLLLTTGCSMGGYHAGDCFFRRPDLFDALISLSGVFQLKMFIGDFMNDSVYFHSPLHFLRNLTDETILNQYRRSRIVVCCGQGAYEGPAIEDAYALREILQAKGVPAWIDIWGYDVNHDWPWWRKQMPYFLDHILP